MCQLEKIVKGYSRDARLLVPRYESISSRDLYHHVAHLLPTGHQRVLDIGAGTGRDAAWLTTRGCEVLAVEPVSEFLEAGQSLHRSPKIQWIADSLPLLNHVIERKELFDFIVLNAVWHHLEPADRAVAMATLCSLISPSGRLLISLRHGFCAPTRPGYPASADEAISLGDGNGLVVIFQHATDSVQAGNRSLGVTWTWLVFEAE